MPYILDSKKTIDVNAMDRFDRFDYWREVVNKEFVNCVCDPLKGQTADGFYASMSGGVTLGQVKFAEIIADRQMVRRSLENISKMNEDDYLINIQIKNTSVISQGGQSNEMHPGEFVLYDSSKPYSLYFPAEFHQLVIQVPREVLQRHITNPDRYLGKPVKCNEGMGRVALDHTLLIAKELGRGQIVASERLAENFVDTISLSLGASDVGHKLIEKDSVKEALLKRIYLFIENNVFDPSLNNEKIAMSQGISVRYLHKLFKNEMESPREVIINRRLTVAMSLLRSGKSKHLSIESVAEAVGFSSVSHFSNAFRKKYGIRPSGVS